MKTKAGGPVFEAKWRYDGAQVKRRLGPAWLESDGAGGWRKRRGRPLDGFLEEKSAIVSMRKVIEGYAEEMSTATQHARAEAAGPTTFAAAAEAWYRRAERRQRKRTTLRDYRQALDAYMLPEPPTRPPGPRARLGIERAPFATARLEDLTGGELRRWFDTIPHGRTKEKLLMIVRAILRHAVAEGWARENVALRVDRDPIVYDGTYDWFTIDEVNHLIAAAATEQHAVLFATAALTGLRRGELLALQWRDIDVSGAKVIVRHNLSVGELTTPKSGRVRTVPLVPRLADQLLRLRDRPHWTSDIDVVFAGEAGGHLDPSAIRRRYTAAIRAAGLRELPFHSLRHHFGTQAVQVASLPQVRDWMGHSDIRTTARYLHARDRVSDAELLSRGFERLSDSRSAAPAPAPNG